MIKSGTSISTPTAGDKECNDNTSHLPTTKGTEQCPRPETLRNVYLLFCIQKWNHQWHSLHSGCPRHCDVHFITSTKYTCHHSTRQSMTSHSMLLWATKKYSWKVLPQPGRGPLSLTSFWSFKRYYDVLALQKQCNNLGSHAHIAVKCWKRNVLQQHIQACRALAKIPEC